MKVCPGCRSISNSSKCGLCGRDLTNIAEYAGTVEDAGRRVAAQREAEGKLLQSKESKKIRNRWLMGVTSGLSVMLLGALLGTFGVSLSPYFLYGYFLIPVGFVYTARVFFSVRPSYGRHRGRLGRFR